MKNQKATLQNNRFFFELQETLKNFLLIVMGVIEEEAENKQSFETFEQNATSSEDRKIIQELKNSSQFLEKEAQEYQKNIGVRTPTKQEQTAKNNSQKTISHSPIIETKSNIDPTISIDSPVSKINKDKEEER